MTLFSSLFFFIIIFLSQTHFTQMEELLHTHTPATASAAPQQPHTHTHKFTATVAMTDDDMNNISGL